MARARHGRQGHRPDYIGSGGVADPGHQQLRRVLQSAAALNRLGKYSVENGVGPAYIHNHTGEFDAKYVDNGVLKTAFDILMERTDPRFVALRSTPSGPPTRSTTRRAGDRRAINK